MTGLTFAWRSAFRSGGYQEEFARGLAAHCRGRRRARATSRSSSSARITAHAVQRQLIAARRRSQHRGGRLGQGRRRQVDRRRESCAGLGARRARGSGILDADIYGPSQPIMLGLDRPAARARRTASASSRCRRTASTAMSIGFLIDPEQPMVWRGPMVTQALTQLLGDTRLGRARLPGHRHAARHRRHPADAGAAGAGAGAVIVTTPQDIALADARKGLKMFEKVERAGARHRREHERARVHATAGTWSTSSAPAAARAWRRSTASTLLGELPLDARIREEADGGAPTVVAAAGLAARARRTSTMARRTAAALARRAKDRQQPVPENRRRRKLKMSIKSDNWIRRMAAEHKMIEPFAPEQVRHVGRPQDRLVRHVELRLRRALLARIQDLHQHQLDHRRSEAFDEKSFVDMHGDVCIIPPNSFALARTVEYFRIPRNDAGGLPRQDRRMRAAASS